MWGPVCFAANLSCFRKAQEAENKEKWLGFSLQKGLTATLIDTAASSAEATKCSRKVEADLEKQVTKAVILS